MNQVVNRKDFFGTLLKNEGYSIVFKFPETPPKFPMNQYYQGKLVCFKGDNVVLFESCDWCGSHNGVKMGLNGEDICLACGGPV